MSNFVQGIPLPPPVLLPAVVFDSGLNPAPGCKEISTKDTNRNPYILYIAKNLISALRSAKAYNKEFLEQQNAFKVFKLSFDYSITSARQHDS